MADVDAEAKAVVDTERKAFEAKFLADMQAKQDAEFAEALSAWRLGGCFSNNINRSQ
jgi:hypothetical protein